MNATEISKGIIKAVLVLTGLALLFYLLYLINSVLFYLGGAMVLALIGTPIVRFLTRRLKFPNTLAVTFTVLFFLALFIGLALMFVPLIVEQSHNLSLMDVDKLRTNIHQIYNQVASHLNLATYRSSTDMEKGLLSKMDFSFIPNFINSIGATLGSFTTGLFSILFISFFLMKDNRMLEGAFFRVLDPNKRIKWQNSIGKIRNLLSRYFLGLVLQISILFVIYTVVLLIFGVESALAIAFLCALLNLIPFIGPLIGGALMVLLTMTSNIGQSFMEVTLPTATYVLLGFLLGQLIDNIFSQPIIFSNSVKSHPLEIFLVIIIAGILFGIIGMVLAIPVYTALKVVLKEFFPENRFVTLITKNM